MGEKKFVSNLLNMIKPKPSRLFFFLLFFSMSISLVGGDLYVWIDVSGGNTTVCEGQRLLLVGNVRDGSGDYVKHSWESDKCDFEIVTDNVISVDTQEPGAYEFEYSVWDSMEDSGSSFIRVIVLPAPDNEIKAKKGFFTWLFGKDYPVKIYLSDKKEIESVEWYKGLELLENENDFKLSVHSPGNYRAKFISNNGCISYSNTIKIE